MFPLYRRLSVATSSKPWLGLALLAGLAGSPGWALAAPLVSPMPDASLEASTDQGKPASGFESSDAGGVNAKLPPPRATTTPSTQTPNNRPAQSLNPAAPVTGLAVEDPGSTSTSRDASRPLLDELKTLGVLDSARSLAADLGLRKSGWSDDANAQEEEATANKPAQGARAWDSPAGQGDIHGSPKTAAQREMDEAMAGYLIRKMVDEVKPWVFGLVGLYLLWQLSKWGFRYSQQKAEKRAKRQRHSARGTRSTSKSRPI